MPDSVIRRASQRFSHVRAVSAKILYFSAKNSGRKVKSGSQLGRTAHSYSTLADAYMSGVKTREAHRNKGRPKDLFSAVALEMGHVDSGMLFNHYRALGGTEGSGKVLEYPPGRDEETPCFQGSR